MREQKNREKNEKIFWVYLCEVYNSVLSLFSRENLLLLVIFWFFFFNVVVVVVIVSYSFENSRKEFSKRENRRKKKCKLIVQVWACDSLGS